MSREGHIFNFPGGEDLTTMAVCWFVSYKYYKTIDNTHENWNNVKSISRRRSAFNRTSELHNYYLSKVMVMNDKNLGKNTIGLSARQVKSMTMELLEVLLRSE